MEESELRHAAGSYVAGELNADESAHFKNLLANNADLQSQVAYWKKMRADLPTMGRPLARTPSNNLAERLHFRLSLENQAPESQNRLQQESGKQSSRPVSFTRLVGQWGGWAAAAALLLSLSMGQQHWQPTQEEVIAQSETNLLQSAVYSENGEAVLPPEAHMNANWASDWSRVRTVSLRNSRDLPDRLPLVSYPWLGVEHKPVTLAENITVHGKDVSKGLMITQVTAESPADTIGLKPGDVILSVADCPLQSRYCIANAMKDADNSEGLPISYWDHEAKKQVTRRVQVGKVYRK